MIKRAEERRKGGMEEGVKKAGKKAGKNAGKRLDLREGGETLDTFDEVGNELVWVRNLLGIDCLRKEGERRVKWFFCE